MSIIRETDDRPMAKTLDRFDLMRLYVRIAETGSLSAAGRSLGLSQPSASRQLRELETALGAQLIMRTTHELSFTEAGQEFLGQARQLLGDWEAVVEGHRLRKDDVRGRLRIAVPNGLGQTILADIAGSFVDRFPSISIEWLLEDEPRDLIGQGIDIWIRVGQIGDESLIVRGLWEIERAIIAAADWPFSPDHPRDLTELPAVILSPYVDREMALTGPDGVVATIAPRPSISTDNLYAAERLTLAGRGYGILPLWLMQPAIEAGRARYLCPGWRPPPLTLSLAYPQTRYRPVRHGLFIDHVKRELRATGAGITPLDR